MQSRTNPPAALRPPIKGAVVAAALVLAVGALTTGLAWDHYVPKRFGIVEPGQLYRGGYTEPGPLREILHDHRIRDILCLADYPQTTDKGAKEHAVAAETGTGLTLIPMPGNGCADFAKLDQAADFIADPAHRPIFVHCTAGVQRTNAAYVAYRLKHCGWSYDRAIAEAERFYLDRRDNPELYDHLRRYADHLHAPTSQPATAPATP